MDENFTYKWTKNKNILYVCSDLICFVYGKVQSTYSR